MSLKNKCCYILNFSILMLLSACSHKVLNHHQVPLKLDRVYLAQHHVQDLDSNYLQLVSDLPALVKVQVSSASRRRSPRLYARLELNGKETDIPLNGPAFLPQPYSGIPELFPHSFQDSFCGYIPKDWLQPGLRLKIVMHDVKSASESRALLPSRELPVGPPNHMVMTMYDIHYFAEKKGVDYPEGWLAEIRAKWPVASLELRRVPNIIFNEIVMPPHSERVAVRCSSEADYKAQTGKPYDGEQGVALRWVDALKAAAGRYRIRQLYYVNIYNVKAGGQAWAFRGVGAVDRHGVFQHEMGHAFSLPHWMRVKNYPYRGHMYGIKAADENFPHAGPVWAFDLERKQFIPPVIQEGTARGKVGHWKRDPMQGGGTGNQEAPFIFNHFSDYSHFKMKNFIQERMAKRDTASGQYFLWDKDKGSYSKKLAKVTSQDFPLKDDVNIISVLASFSAVDKNANIIYPLIGPYKGGIIPLYEATSEADRQKAAANGFDAENTHFCLRVTQGAKTRTILMQVKHKASDTATKPGSLKTAAVNLLVSDGEITKVQVLYTPDVMNKGLGLNPKVLTEWTK